MGETRPVKKSAGCPSVLRRTCRSHHSQPLSWTVFLMASMRSFHAKTYILFDRSCHILLSFSSPFACSLSRTGDSQKGFVAPPSKFSI